MEYPTDDYNNQSDESPNYAGDQVYNKPETSEYSHMLRDEQTVVAEPEDGKSSNHTRRNILASVGTIAGAAVLFGGAYTIARQPSSPDNRTVAVGTDNPGNNSDPTQPPANTETNDNTNNKSGIEALMGANLCDALKGGEDLINPSMDWYCEPSTGDGVTKAGLKADHEALISVAVAPQGDESGQLLYKYVDGVKNYDNGTYVQSFKLKNGTKCDWVMPESEKNPELRGKVADAALDCFVDDYQVEVMASDGMHLNFAGDDAPGVPNHRTKTDTFMKIANDSINALNALS